MTRRSGPFVAAGSALALALFLAAAPRVTAAAGPAPGTPPEMVAAYDSLADGILALKRAEANLVRSILAAAHGHAQAELGRARKAIAASDGGATRAALEALAGDVAQMATEGDAAVGAVRKRLIEGGHHHHADGEAQGLYDEGYVVVTRAAKQRLLESSRALAQMAASPQAEALTAEWQKVEAVYAELAARK